MSRKFLKPQDDDVGGSSAISITEERGEDKVITFNSHYSLSIEKQRQRLPIFNYRTHILYLLQKYSVVVIIGETGCGKSTQIPQYLLESGWSSNEKCICITQPRRMAAVSLAKRVAEEKDVEMGREVGYAVRFEDSSSEKTRIKFVTDGLLIREIMMDPLLTKYSVIMIDEAHERTLATDMILSLLKKILKKRPELKIIVASATIDAQKIMDYFNTNTSDDPSQDTVAALTVEGRMFPVEIFYSVDPVPNYVEETMATIMKIHRSQDFGDILAFLTGQDEVDEVVKGLRLRLEKNDMPLNPVPLYAGLPMRDQMKAFERPSKHVRKVVVATNIAETSLTINGIVYVVDCGFMKISAFNSKCALDCLIKIPASKASATQRAGRAGRVRSGKVFRLYTEGEFEKLPVATVPEMQRTSTSGMILQLKALGIDKILKFDFLSPPPTDNMLCGLELLYALGAIDDNCLLTDPIGRRLAELPLLPQFGKMLLISGELECSEEAVIICAMTQIQNVFHMPPNRKLHAEKARRKFSVAEGDHLTLVNVFRAFQEFNMSAKWCRENYLNYKGLMRAVELVDRLTRFLKLFKIPLISCCDKSEPILKCVVSGFFCNAAKYHPSGVYKTIRGNHNLQVHPTSVLYTELPAEYVIFNEVVHAGSDKNFMRDVTVVKLDWLLEMAPHYFEYGTDREIFEKRTMEDYSALPEPKRMRLN